MTSAACGLMKCMRIKLMSALPSTVAFMDVLALGASIMTRIQTSLPREAASRAEVATGLPWDCGPLATTLSIVLAAAGLR